MIKTNHEMETIMLCSVCKQGTNIFINTTPDTNLFELYGFLKTYNKKLEVELIESMSHLPDND